MHRITELHYVLQQDTTNGSKAEERVNPVNTTISTAAAPSHESDEEKLKARLETINESTILGTNTKECAMTRERVYIANILYGLVIGQLQEVS